MAGIQGMGSPRKLVPQVAPVAPEAPEGMEFNSVSDQVTQSPTPMAQPSQQAAPPAGLRPSLDEIFSAAEPPKPSLDDIFGMSPAAEPVEEEFTTDQPGILNRIGEIPSRAKASFAVTDKELLQSLKQSFGDENVKKDGEDIKYKGKDGKWRIWDNGTTIEDFSVDLLRPVVEETPATLATIAAAFPAVATAIGTGGASTPLAVAGTAAARSAGGLAGQGLADLAQAGLGIERDPDRNAYLEYGATAVLSPIAGGMADWATKKIAAKVALSKASKLLPPEKLYKTEIEGIKESLDQVKKLGGMENIPGTDTPLMLAHLNPSNPQARAMSQAASELPGFQQAQEQIVQSFEDSSKAYLKTLGNLDAKGTGQGFKDYVQSAIKQEGEAIGKVRQGLIDAAGNGELPIPNLKKKVEGFAEGLGFKINGETDLAALKNYLVDEEGYSKQAAEVIVNKTNKMLEKVTNKEGRLTAKELVGSYEELNGLYRNLAQGGGDVSPLFKNKIGEFRRFFADELADKVEVIADKGSKASYLKDLARYRELVTSADEFSSLLDKDSLASHSLSKAIFNKGANGLDTAKATKVLLRDKPELLADVRGSFLQDALADSFNEATKKTDWNKFNKKLLDPQLKPIMEEMFGPKALEGLKAYQVVGKAIDSGNVGVSGSATRAKFLKDLSATGLALQAGEGAIDLLKKTDANDILAEIVSKEGIDNFLKTAPKESKPFLRKILSGLQTAAYRGAQAAEIPVRRMGRNTSRDEANKANQEP